MSGNRERLRFATGEYDGRTPRLRWRLDMERVVEKVPRGAGNAIKRCIIGEKPWPLALLGEAGAGKTCASLCLLDRYGGLYWTLAEWAERLSDARFGRLTCEGSGYVMTLHEVREQWRLTNLGVLDEIGSRATVTDHEAESLLWAIDRRIGRPLILISNRTLEELAGLYGEPTASRIGAGTLVTLSGDQRIAAIAELKEGA